MPQTSVHRKRTAESLRLVALIDEHKDEVLKFLALRPIHTVCMAGYIRDHGMVSPLNRGVFYGCWDPKGKLEGVALIGHATLIETGSDEALKAFAQLQHQCSYAYLIRGEHEMISRFWRYFSELGHLPRLCCRELLFEHSTTPSVSELILDLRLATSDELDAIARVNAEMIRSECGVDPLQTDAKGFRERVARRIEQGRVWVWRRKRRLIFKADVFAETPEMSYLEGINVHPLERGRGHGRRCVERLTELLLQRSRSICLLVNEQRTELSDFYAKAGYEFRSKYDTIYF